MVGNTHSTSTAVNHKRKSKTTEERTGDRRKSVAHTVKLRIAAHTDGQTKRAYDDAGGLLSTTGNTTGVSDNDRPWTRNTGPCCYNLTVLTQPYSINSTLQY